MSALTDLQAAVARLAASTSAEIKAVSDKLASLGGSASDADVEAAVTQLNATADALDAEAASLAPAPPAPTPLTWDIDAALAYYDPSRWLVEAPAPPAPTP